METLPRHQRHLAFQRAFGGELELQKTLRLQRARMIEKDRLVAAQSRIFHSERENPVLVDSHLESGNGVSRLEHFVGLDRGSESQVAERRFEKAGDWGVEKPVAVVERRLEAGVERRLEKPVVNDRRVDRTLDNNRIGARPPPLHLESMMSTDREKDENRDKIRDRAREDEKLIVSGEKQKQRDDSPGAMQELLAQYKTALAELTFNSKPIITNLTIIAGENPHAAKLIAATVCAHVLEVPVEQKLPSLYLVDSIVKNIGSIYVKQFASRLSEVFIKVYRQVDPSTYSAMQHLFKTWKGVFPSELLRAIETELEFNFTVNGTPSSNPARADESPHQHPGHSIHVNPKYLEAQRHKLQLSSHAISPPPRIQTVNGSEASYVGKSGTNFLDYEFGSVDTGGDGGGSSGDRDRTWDKGWPLGKDALRPHEGSPPLRYGLKNGYEMQQPLVDAYGNIRGIRAPRLPSIPAQPDQDSDGRNRGLSRNWRNSEEEEYIWENYSPRLPDIMRHGDGLRKDKDDWYSGDTDKDPMCGAVGGGKPFFLDQPLSNPSGWRKHTPLAVMDRPAPSETRVRDIDERAPFSCFHQGIGQRFVLNAVSDVPTFGPSSSMMVNRLMTGRLPNAMPQQLGPPRHWPLQLAVPKSTLPMGQGSQATNIYGPTVFAPPLTASASVHPILSGSLLNFGSLSPVTATSGLNFQHKQHLNRPSSPPPIADLSQKQLPRQPLPPSLHYQLNLLQQRAMSLNHVEHHGQALGLQPHSLQQPSPLNPLLQKPPSVHPSPPQLPPLHIYPQELSLSESTAEHVSGFQPLHTVPMLPELPTQILHSLQQLQHHLPPLSGALSHSSQPVQSPFQLQSPAQQGQSTPLSQHPQSLHNALPQTHTQQLQRTPQTVSQVTPPIESIVSNNPSTMLFEPQSHNSNKNLLAAFLQCGLMPPSQASQLLSHHSPSSPKVAIGLSEVTISQPTQVQPPLPSRPPPTQYPTSETNPLDGQGTVASLPAPANLPSAFALMHVVQPPLPPGPTPVSSQGANSISLPPSVAGQSGGHLTSLLSSLMEQGVISAPSSVPILPQPAGVHNMPVSLNNPLNLLSGGSLVASPAGSFTSLDPVASATLVTALRTHEPTSVVTLAPSETVATGDPIETQFRPEFLRERKEPVINALYANFPRQCKTCGLRFKHQEEHSKHMDWHVAKNHKQISSKKVSRNWFVNVKEWLNGTEAAEVSPFFSEDILVKSDEPETVAVPADENQSACALCGEPFEDFYSNEAEEWMYKGAVFMNAPSSGVKGLDSSLLGPIVHAKCRSESAATAAIGLMEDAELEEEDNLGYKRKRVRY